MKKGKGLLLVSCTNIPEEINGILTSKNRLTLPEDFYNIPEIDKRYKISRQLPLITKIWQVEKGKVGIIDGRNYLYPCVPADKKPDMYPNIFGREISYWEYKLFPIIKSILSLSGKESDIKINNISKAEDNILNLKIESKTDFSGVLESNYLDNYGQIEKSEKYPISLKSGDNNVNFTIPALSGGEHLVDYRLMDSKGLIYDFGSYSFNAPLTAEIKEVKLGAKEPSYKVGEEIKAEVELNNISSGTKLSWYVEDATYRRVLRKGSQELSKGQDKVNISFNINRPLGIIYYLFVKVEKDNKLENISMKEFSMPYHYPPVDELLGYGWFVYHGSVGFKAWKDSGFDVMINSAPRYTGLFKVLSTANLRPGVYGLLHSIGDPDKGSRYRGDHGREGDDIIRKPCYSDPNWWAEMKESIEKQATQYNPSYYGAKDYSLSDECFLGSNVCYSEYCLKDFRDYLKKEYRNLNELNKSWATSFNSWEEVIPIQRKEVKKEKDNMAAWLDHKIFMTTVFAKIAEKMKNIVDGINVDIDIQIGLSGMQNPGYSYNWAELMKYHTSLQHYEGVQKDLIRSFRRPGTRYGMWVGYASENIDAEKYSRYHIWRSLFNQANGYMYFYHDYAMLGDFTFAQNTKYALEELQIAKKGIDKMLLSSELVCDIGMHYSHSSLFASTATISRYNWSNTADSWISIINDLGLNFKFVSTEQLEKVGLNKDEYKVFILPASLCLSDKEIEALRKYVESGGVLISDYGVGIYDIHGKKQENKRLLELFGFKRGEGSDLALSSSEVRVKGDIVEGLTSRTLKLKFGEKGLKLTTGKAYSDMDEAAIIINRFGSGKAVLLNCVMSDYSQVTLSGVGGELSEVKKGMLEVNEQIKGFARDIFKIGGISPEVLIRTLTGVDLQSLTKTSIWKNGNIRYVGLLNEPDNMYNKISPEEILDINITFENKGHIYDVKEKKYLGLNTGNKQIKTKIAPTIANIYSILPYRVSRIDVTPDKKSYKAGEVVVCSVKVITSGGQAGNHIGYVEVVGPDKQVRNYYTQKVILKNGAGTIEVPISFNDDIGNWAVNIRDVASGISKKIDVRVTK